MDSIHAKAISLDWRNAPLVKQYRSRLPNSTKAPQNEKWGWRRRQLTLRVHFDAFRLEPWRYLEAVVWRLRGLRLRSRNRFAELIGKSPSAYALWIEKIEPKTRATSFASAPGRAFSLIGVIDCTESEEDLGETISSFKGVERLIVVGGADKMGPFVWIPEPTDLAELVPDASWLCIARSGDRLSESALDTYAGEGRRLPKSSIFYADDDLIGLRGERQLPHFKPSWNPELFAHHDFVTHSCILKVSTSALRKLRPEGWVRDLVLDLISSENTPLRIPMVLHHRRQRPKATRSLAAVGAIGGSSAAEVTVIVPTRNQLPLLRNCINGVKQVDYPAVEILIVDNGTDDTEALEYLHSLEGQGARVVRIPGPFNYSALNNAAVRQTRTEYLCFLNNDVEMMDSAWLRSMIAQAMRADIGAVGARLLYPDHTIQHAGVVTGIGGGAGHAHRFQALEAEGYFNRANLPQRTNAVTGACMTVARHKFLAVGGFDEVNFPVAFNDVDLCLKLNERGWQSFYEPRATLIHHESKSRGDDRARLNRTRFAGELAALKRKWGTDCERDPYHHPHLSPFCEQFVIAV